jgi:hypothetical protein
VGRRSNRRERLTKCGVPRGIRRVGRTGEDAAFCVRSATRPRREGSSPSMAVATSRKNDEAADELRARHQAEQRRPSRAGDVSVPPARPSGDPVSCGVRRRAVNGIDLPLSLSSDAGLVTARTERGRIETWGQTSISSPFLGSGCCSRRGAGAVAAYRPRLMEGATGALGDWGAARALPAVRGRAAGAEAARAPAPAAAAARRARDQLRQRLRSTNMPVARIHLRREQRRVRWHHPMRDLHRD